MPIHNGTYSAALNTWNVTGVYDEPNAGYGLPNYGPLGVFAGTDRQRQKGKLKRMQVIPLISLRPTNPTISLFSQNGGLYNYGYANTFVNPYSLADFGFGTMFRDSRPDGKRSYSPSPSRPFPANILSDDFLKTGSINGDWYQSSPDLLLLPEDFQSLIANQSAGNGIVNDSTVPITGRYLQLNSPGVFSMGTRTPDEGQDTFGQRWPRGKGTFYLLAKSGVATTQVWHFQCNGDFVTPTTVSLTTSWAIYPIPYDSTGCSTSSGLHIYSDATTASTSVQFAFIGMVPQTDSLQVGTLTANSLTATTSKVTNLNFTEPNSGLSNAAGPQSQSAVFAGPTAPSSTPYSYWRIKHADPWWGGASCIRLSLHYRRGKHRHGRNSYSAVNISKATRRQICLTAI